MFTSIGIILWVTTNFLFLKNGLELGPSSLKFSGKPFKNFHKTFTIHLNKSLVRVNGHSRDMAGVDKFLSRHPTFRVHNLTCLSNQAHKNMGAQNQSTHPRHN